MQPIFVAGAEHKFLLLQLELFVELLYQVQLIFGEVVLHKDLAVFRTQKHDVSVNLVALVLLLVVN